MQTNTHPQTRLAQHQQVRRELKVEPVGYMFKHSGHKLRVHAVTNIYSDTLPTLALGGVRLSTHNKINISRQVLISKLNLRGWCSSTQNKKTQTNTHPQTRLAQHQQVRFDLKVEPAALVVRVKGSGLGLTLTLNPNLNSRALRSHAHFT